MEEQFYSLDADQRITLVRQAVEAGQPLMIRWAKVEPDFGDRWQHRAAAAAGWLAGATKIVDLGCGSMNLERCLRPGQCYVPVDFVRRDKRTVVRDLNKSADLARLPTADACALLGVLEYIYGPHELIVVLYGRYAQMVATFNVLRDDETAEDRLGDGWVNHFTHSELLSFFADHSYILARDHLFEGKRREYLSTCNAYRSDLEQALVFGSFSK